MVLIGVVVVTVSPFVRVVLFFVPGFLLFFFPRPARVGEGALKAGVDEESSSADPGPNPTRPSQPRRAALLM
jgi:hypothetical protein